MPLFLACEYINIDCTIEGIRRLTGSDYKFKQKKEEDS